jgi:hypothetical protein
VRCIAVVSRELLAQFSVSWHPETPGVVGCCTAISLGIQVTGSFLQYVCTVYCSALLHYTRLSCLLLTLKVM